MTRRLAIRQESFPIRGEFRISRGAKTAAEVVVAEIAQGDLVGRGECVPYSRYGETREGIVALLTQCRPQVESGIDRPALQSLLPAGAARNALDCALWDLQAKLSGQPVWQSAGLSALRPVTTAYTISLDTPAAMATAAQAAGGRPILKLKMGGDGDLDRVRAVRQAVPAATLLVDANEAWTVASLTDIAPALAALGVKLIEQPLPAGQDEALRGLDCPVPLGADESFHAAADLERMSGLYRLVNIKLDKTGGLTEALATRRKALATGFDVMVGCMVGSSLAMAPALLVAQDAAFVDLDGPLLLAEDRSPGLHYDGAMVYPAEPALWG